MTDDVSEPFALPPPAADGVRPLAREMGVSVTLADWLGRRGKGPGPELGQFLAPKLAHLTPPDRMADREVAAERLARAIKAGELVTVFGDYDCDGITSTAIVTEMIRALGGTATPLLANRFGGGYGVSAPACDRILATRPALLVTCDCGSSDHASLARIRAAGIDAIVLDHHLVPDEPLPALAFLNPHRPECGFAYKGLASCGLALSIAAAVRKHLNQPLDVRRWLDLVAIGTIADVAPLDGDNRALVRAGLTAIREAARPGIAALLEVAKVDPRATLTGRDVAFRLAPKINAAGRMGPPDIALELLLARDRDTATTLASEVERLSLTRRQVQDQIQKEAEEDIAAGELRGRAAIVVGRQGWNHGIVGIVAGRLADEHGLPVCVVGFDGNVGRGSLRGPPGYRLHDALSEAAAAVVRFGGHQAAAGVEVHVARFAEFQTLFEAACAKRPVAAGGSRNASSPESMVRCDAADGLRAVLGDLGRLEPCGEQNPRPNVCLRARVDSARSVGDGHLKLELTTLGGERFGAFAVGRGDRLGEFARGAEIWVSGDLRADTWRGGDAVEIFVEQIGKVGATVTPQPSK